MKTVFFDLDGTLAEWKESDNINLREDGYFFMLAPMEITKYANSLCESGDVRVCILSSYLTDCRALPDKNAWCDRYCSAIPRENRVFVPDGMSKYLYAEQFLGRKLTKDDILIDDYTKNCLEWEERGGSAIKWLNGINGSGGRFKGPRIMWTCELDAFIRN